MIKNKKIIIIEDTNIWISFLVGSKHNDLLAILDDPDYKIMYCKELINELYESLKQPKLTKYYSKQDVNKLVRQIRQKAYRVDTNPPYPSRSRDKKDDYLLELAIITKADYLITGDSQLPTVKTVGLRL